MWIANILSLAAHAAEGPAGYFLGQSKPLVVVLFLLVLVLMGCVLSAFGSFIFSLRSIDE